MAAGVYIFVSAFSSLFSTRYLTDEPGGIPGVWFDIFTALLVVALIVAIYVYIRRRPLSRGVTPRRHVLRQISEWTMWICGIGLFFCLMRYVQLEYLDKRIFTYLVVLGAILAGGYLAYYLSERYPVRVYNFNQLGENRRYRTVAKRKPQAAVAPAGRSGIQRGKKKR
jgi:hypothetical protein